MQRITDKIAALPYDGNYFSLEFFPPKTQPVCTFQVTHNTPADEFVRVFRIYGIGLSACHLLYDHYS